MTHIDMDIMTPREIVEELNKYIVGQSNAKRAVAVAVRNRYRRKLVSDDIREEIYPKNILMIGPTGCGKTEIARRLSKLSGAPFVKVEATKFTEIGYVGRDVESMIRDLVNVSINIVKKEFQKVVEEEASKHTEERLLDILLPESQENTSGNSFFPFGDMSSKGAEATSGIEKEKEEERAKETERHRKVRELFREKLRKGELEEREVEIDITASPTPMVQVLSGHNLDDIDMQVQNMLGDIMPKKNKKRRVSISDARKIFLAEESDKLVDHDKVNEESIRRCEQMGIVFIDEVDKICGKGQSHGPDVSREGVQRDLLPIVEGATVTTKYGPVKTDHILFIAAGAFHQTKPSDLIPELQGRFPIRVELDKLTENDFKIILTGPQNSLTKQASALLGVDGVRLEFTEEGISEIARMAFHVNEITENIGARRLHTIMEKLLDEISFQAPDLPEHEKKVSIDRNFVNEKLKSIADSRDLSQYIL